MVPYEEKSTVTEGAKRPTQVLGILQIIKGNSYSTSRKLRVVDLNPKTAITLFETTVVWEYNLPEIMYRGDCFPFPWLLQVGSIISGYFVASRTLDLAGAPSCNTMHTATT